MPRRGQRHSEETKRRISKSLRGHIVPTSVRTKIRETLKGRHCSPKTEFKPGQNVGSKSPSWKGGEVIKKGYKGSDRVLIADPDNPMCTGGGYVLRSRIIMSKMIGRPLEPKEVVHHIDGDTINDDPGNLLLFESNAKHTTFHSKGEKNGGNVSE